MDSSIKNSYVYSDKFRDSSGDIHWLDIISYPYDSNKSFTNKLKIIFSSPIIIYVLLGTLLIINIIDPLQSRNKAYFYTIMFSLLIILILFVIHMIIFNFIVDPTNVNIELRLGDKGKVKKTYEAFYRTQWLLLLVFSPIYMACIVYAVRKLDSKGSK